MTEIQLQTMLRPRRNLIVVKADPVEVKTETDGGIALPDEAQPVAIKRTGVVVEVGPETNEERAKVGERVLFSAYSGTTVLVDGQEYELMRDEDVLAWL